MAATVELAVQLVQEAQARREEQAAQAAQPEQVLRQLSALLLMPAASSAITWLRLPAAGQPEMSLLPVP
jgi:hypothetical protein